MPGTSIIIYPAGSPALRTVSSNYAALSTDTIILANAATAPFSITLPTAVGVNGKNYIVKKTDSTENVVTLATTSGQTIDGMANDLIATPLESDTYVSDGANWQKT